jgi:hypothetical protein
MEVGSGGSDECTEATRTVRVIARVVVKLLELSVTSDYAAVRLRAQKLFGAVTTVQPVWRNLGFAAVLQGLAGSETGITGARYLLPGVVGVVAADPRRLAELFAALAAATNRAGLRASVADRVQQMVIDAERAMRPAATGADVGAADTLCASWQVTPAVAAAAAGGAPFDLARARAYADAITAEARAGSVVLRESLETALSAGPNHWRPRLQALGPLLLQLRPSATALTPRTAQLFAAALADDVAPLRDTAARGCVAVLGWANVVAAGSTAAPCAKGEPDALAWTSSADGALGFSCLGSSGVDASDAGGGPSATPNFAQLARRFLPQCLVPDLETFALDRAAMAEIAKSALETIMGPAGGGGGTSVAWL